MVALITTAGGVDECNRQVDTLDLAGTAISGVGHHAQGGGDDRVDEAPIVFGNAAPQSLASMLPESERPAPKAAHGH